MGEVVVRRFSFVFSSHTCITWSQCRDCGSCVSARIINDDAASRDLVLQTNMHKHIISDRIDYLYKNEMSNGNLEVEGRVLLNSDYYSPSSYRHCWLARRRPPVVLR